jgi:hypothetical protein
LKQDGELTPIVSNGPRRGGSTHGLHLLECTERKEYLSCAGASSSRAGPAARPEQEREHADAPPAHFVDAQAEQSCGRSSVITALRSTGR